jgi:hypothetical protein
MIAASDATVIKACRRPLHAIDKRLVAKDSRLPFKGFPNEVGMFLKAPSLMI